MKNIRQTIITISNITTTKRPSSPTVGMVRPCNLTFDNIK